MNEYFIMLTIDTPGGNRNDIETRLIALLGLTKCNRNDHNCPCQTDDTLVGTYEHVSDDLEIVSNVIVDILQRELSNLPKLTMTVSPVAQTRIITKITPDSLRIAQEISELSQRPEINSPLIPEVQENAQAINTSAQNMEEVLNRNQSANFESYSVDRFFPNNR